MKKKGRGASYQKALYLNLQKALLRYGKITTTKTRGKNLITKFFSDRKNSITLSRAKTRRGDNAPMVTIEIKKKTEKTK